MKLESQLLSKRYYYYDKGSDKTILMPILSRILQLLSENESDLRVQHQHCPGCLHNRSKIISQRENSGLPMVIVACEICGLIYALHRFSNKFYREFYSQFYSHLKLQNRTSKEIFDSRVAKNAYSWKRRNFVKECLGIDYSDIKTVVEIGGVDGSNLYPYFVDGKKVIGCDFDEQRLKPGIDLGLNLIKGDIEELQDLNIRADLVILSHKLEQFPLPSEYLSKIKKLLRANGYVFVEVPNLLTWIQKKRKRVKLPSGYGNSNNFLNFLRFNSLYYFTPVTLGSLMQNSGYVEVQSDEVIRGVYQLIDKTAPKEQTDQKSSKHGSLVLNHLIEVEKDFVKRNVFLIRWIKSIRNLLLLYLR